VDSALNIIGYASLPLLLFAITYMVKSIRKNHLLTYRNMIIPILTSVLFLMVYSYLLEVNTIFAISLPTLVLGIVVGVFWGGRVELSVQKKQGVYGKRSLWYLGIWGISIGITELLALVVSPELISYGVSTIYFATGLIVGLNGYLLFRTRSMISRSVPKKK